jgi:hypothetical protein
VYGKINSAMVGVGDGVNVIVGTGEGVIVSMTICGGGRVGGSIAEEAGWQDARRIKTSEAVLWINRQRRCFMDRLYQNNIMTRFSAHHANPFTIRKPIIL